VGEASGPRVWDFWAWEPVAAETHRALGLLTCDPVGVGVGVAWDHHA